MIPKVRLSLIRRTDDINPRGRMRVNHAGTLAYRRMYYALAMAYRQKTTRTYHFLTGRKPSHLGLVRYAVSMKINRPNPLNLITARVFLNCRLNGLDIRFSHT